MKKVYILFFTAILLSSTGCEKYLDKKDQIGLSEDDVFSRYEGVKGYLDATYGALNDIHTQNSQGIVRSTINAMSDEAGSLGSSDLTGLINTGDWLLKPNAGEIGDNRGNAEVGTVVGAVMDNAYFALRITNNVIANAATVPNITQQQLDEILGQAYFMRGWYYFQLIQRVGGLPIYDKVYAPNDNLDLPRKTYAESNEFVMFNMDEAIKRLPHKWADQEAGRATKAAAMSVKEMAMLYAASPLMQNSLTSTVNNGYGIPQAELAAQYANDLIQYCKSNTGGTSFQLLPGAQYANVFYQTPANASKEQLWYYNTADVRNQKFSLRGLYLPGFFAGGTGPVAVLFTNPTQNIVDMFEVLNNGRAYLKDDAGSGYNPQNPYINRDPRFYNDIIIPGEKWAVKPNNTPAYQELFVGGRDRTNAEKSAQTSSRTVTGYLCKKFIWQEANATTDDFNKYNLTSCYIRLAQVYLDYAEAMNEAYGPTSDPKGYGLTAEGAINIVRNRVNMPNISNLYTGSKSLFRDRLRNERGVELMWENHRWHDLRRWMIAEDVLSKPIRGMQATPLNPNFANVADKSTLLFNYKVVDLNTEVRVFKNKHYWYPVNQRQVNDQFNYVQNPGW
jgi:hypothetical protein